MIKVYITKWDKWIELYGVINRDEANYYFGEGYRPPHREGTGAWLVEIGGCMVSAFYLVFADNCQDACDAFADCDKHSHEIDLSEEDVWERQMDWLNEVSPYEIKFTSFKVREEFPPNFVAEKKPTLDLQYGYLVEEKDDEAQTIPWHKLTKTQQDEYMMKSLIWCEENGIISRLGNDSHAVDTDHMMIHEVSKINWFAKKED